MKKENTNLKKNKTVQQTIELKEQLHQANIALETSRQDLIRLRQSQEVRQGEESTPTEVVTIDTQDDYGGEARDLGIDRFELLPTSTSDTSSEPANFRYIQESVRLLRYIKKLQATVNTRIDNLTKQGGQGISAYAHLVDAARLMKSVKEETTRAMKMVLKLEHNVEKGGQ